MKVVIQRVQHASVTVDKQEINTIGLGLLILAGFEHTDTPMDINWTASKCAKIRIFNDKEGKMNLSLEEVGGEILCISQFTLHSSTVKGNRPSFIQSAKADIAEKLYDEFCNSLSNEINTPVKKGVFGADMKVSLLNDGPVTIIIDSKNKS